MFLQAADIFTSEPSLKSVNQALDLVESVITVTEDGASFEELSVTTDLLKNTTNFLLRFQNSSDEVLMLNEV